MWRYHPDLLATPVPRYTSFPTAAEFGDDVGQGNLKSALDSIDPEEPLSLYLHIPYCREICWYCGCNTGAANKRSRLAAYIRRLREEIALTAAAIRRRQRVSRLGAFYDSVFDRAGEVVVYLGIVWGTLDFGLWLPIVLAAGALASSTMVSYVRAKSEGLGFTPGTGMAAVGLAPREVRVAILGIGLLVAGLLPGFPEDMDGAGGLAYPLSGLAIDATLALITVLATVTVIQRILHVRRQATVASTDASTRPSITH